jgi:aromatase
VYHVFADLHAWEAILPDVECVDILYDDGFHQEYTMVVQRSGRREAIRGARFCRPCSRIDVFQPKPPPGVSRLTGVWLFASCVEGTRVTAERELDVLPPSLPAEIAQRTQGALGRNLELFRRHLEGI